MRCMSFVFQDVTLFNDTVFNNIRVGNMNATEEQVMAAAKQGYCDEFIQRLPDGYQTVLGENGSTWFPAVSVSSASNRHWSRSGRKIYERHCFFMEQLIAAGVDPKIAEADACRLEHVISSESFERLKETADQ